jgi:hypothetical protein
VDRAGAHSAGGLLRLFALIGAPVLAVAWFAPEPTPAERIRSFDARPLAELRASKPRYVLIGNSMLGSRIDPKLLASEIGVPVSSLMRYGSASAVWYLLMKNYVAEANLGDCTVAVFYRDTALTEPGLRLWRREALRAISREDDPTLEEILAERGSSWQQRTRHAALVWANPDAWRSSFRNAVNHAALRRNRRVGGVDLTEVNVQRINAVFALDDLRGGDGDAIPESHILARYDFDSNVEQSFLPHMLDLADQNGFKLWFVQVKRRPRRNGAPRPHVQVLDEYTRSLRAYLEDRNAGLIDLRESPRVTHAMYGRRDHISRAHRDAYTRMFPELAAAMFQGRVRP